MRDDYETLLLERPGPHLLLITLNRPEAANAMNTQMGRDFLDLYRSLMLEVGDLRCVVVTGAGERAFCAGGDLKERNNMTDDEWQAQHVIFEQAMYTWMDCPLPVIAAVNGSAYAGGCEMVMACDFAYASTKARFALTEVTLGIMPGVGGTQNLPRAVGTRRAAEIVLTGLPFMADEAHAWGLVNRVTEPDELMAAVLETATKICENAPISVRQAKKAVRLAREVDLKRGLAFEVEAYNRMIPTEDRQEGIRAFNEKRKPKYVGR